MTDIYKTQPVAVIDQTLARQYWPNENPLGQQVKFAFGRGLQGLTIIGVVGDIKSDGFESPTVPHICVPLGQFAPVNAVVFLRSENAAEHLGEAVRHEVESLNANVPVHSVSSMDQIIARSVADRGFTLMSSSRYESCCLPPLSNRFHTSGQCSLSSSRIARALHSLSAPETTRVAFDSPCRRLIYAAFLGSHSCFSSLSIPKLSLQHFVMSATSFLNLRWSASLGRTSSPATSRPSIGSSNPRVEPNSI